MLLLATLYATLVSIAATRLENNAYKDIIVAISQDVAEDASLIETVKKLFTDASPYLYEATNRRAYFSDVTIVVPESWSDRTDVYEAATASETYARAKVRINPPEVFGGIESNTAFVESTALCGGEGFYMHITPKRMTDPYLSRASPPHRMLVHEWAHLRWGIFDEYFQSFYGLDGDGKAGRCPQKIQAVRSSFGSWRYGTDGVAGSIMWKQYYNDIIRFCDDGDNPSTKHYRESMTAQNRFCDMQSIWGVMLKHADFRNNANPPREVSSTQPTFRVVRQRSSPVVCLVLDVSSSMVVKGRWSKLRQAAKSFVDNVPSGTQVCIITFSTSARVKQKPMAVTDQASRDLLGSKLAQVPFTLGRTNITKGVLKGVSELSSAGGINKEMVLVSDGQTTEPPYLNDPDVEKLILDSKVRIHTVGFGVANTNMSRLPELTGGMAFSDVEAGSQPTILQEAFIELNTGGERTFETPYPIVVGSITVKNGSTEKIFVNIDRESGRDTEFNIYYSPGVISHKKLKIQILSPPTVMTYESNRRDKKCQDTLKCDDKFRICTLKLSKAESGSYAISVYQDVYSSVDISYSVVCKQADRRQDPIIMRTFLSQQRVEFPATVTISALLTRGALTVLKATVVAVVTRPFGNPVNIYLRDEGAGPDLFKDDGLYSGTFTQFSASGSYNVKVIATSDYTMNMNMTDAHGRSKRMKEMMESRRAEFGRRFRKDDYDFENTTVSSEILGIEMEQVSVFQRTKSAGSFEASGYDRQNQSDDMYPPSRIMDLSGNPKLEGSQTVTLKWTAPGNDMETGSASQYDIRVGKTFDSLANDFDGQRQVDERLLREPTISNMAEPQMAGLEEMLSFRNPYRSANVIYVAVKSSDETRESGMSNVAAINFCNCLTLSEAVCKHTYVLIATVESIQGDDVTFRDVTYLKNKKLLSALGLSAKMKITVSQDPCNCRRTFEPEKTYLLTASFNDELIRFEVTEDSYAEVSTDLVTDQRKAEELVSTCSLGIN